MGIYKSENIKQLNKSKIIIQSNTLYKCKKEIDLNWDSRGLEYNSWEKIQLALQFGIINKYVNVGDTKNITFNNKTVKMQLVSINDGTGGYAQYYPDKTADFVCQGLPIENYVYHNNNTNHAWSKCNMRSYLQSLYNTLSSDLKNVIIDKYHIYYVANIGSELVGDKLWIPTGYELGSGTGYGDSSTNNKTYTGISESYSARKRGDFYVTSTGGNQYSLQLLVKSDGSFVMGNSTFGRSQIFGFRIG